MRCLRAILPAVALVLSLVVTGCADRSVTAERGDTLVDFEIADAGTMDPLFAVESQAALYDGLVFDALVDAAPDLGVCVRASRPRGAPRPTGSTGRRRPETPAERMPAS